MHSRRECIMHFTPMEHIHGSQGDSKKRQVQKRCYCKLVTRSWIKVPSRQEVYMVK